MNYPNKSDKLYLVKLNEQQLKNFAWGVSVLVSAVAVIAWGQLYDWELGNLSVYQVFPLFGLLAFGLMWTQYIVAAFRLKSGLEKAVTQQYFEITSLAVLAAILLHPGLLAWQLWKDGAGLPPSSEVNYVQPALRWVVVLGIIAWVIFLSYELRRWMQQKPWWKYVQYLSDLAMFAIFYHGLKLGSHLGAGWFRGVWLFYGISLVVSLTFIYKDKLKPSRA